MIQANNLSKRYGSKVAIDNISFSVRPGTVTGFLGPNGAGKSTTMRMMVGLDRPTSGTVTINGRPYRTLRSPLHEVGVLLDAKAVHPGRSAYNHLRSLAATHGIPKSRVLEVIELTGLRSVAKKRVGGFSLGMGQRLGIAAALLGDPQTLILDEPVNGLDPDGVLWVRALLRRLAAEGRTVLLSSHLISEMAMTADHIIVLGKGRVIADAPVAEIIALSGEARVRVVSPNAIELARLLAGSQTTIVSKSSDSFEITGISAAEISSIAAVAQLPVHELNTVTGSLEDAYLALTADSVEYQTTLSQLTPTAEVSR